ncbi:hypothetical protein B0H10DRAFT_1969192 [Mycena sp. CBHHK59/15]|nr:hypothetical protein B0H10DRAFT_1969192 [Mycena sp. CBHHK59/15]
MLPPEELSTKGLNNRVFIMIMGAETATQTKILRTCSDAPSDKDADVPAMRLAKKLKTLWSSVRAKTVDLDLTRSFVYYYLQQQATYSNSCLQIRNKFQRRVDAFKHVVPRRYLTPQQWLLTTRKTDVHRLPPLTRTKHPPLRDAHGPHSPSSTTRTPGMAGTYYWRQKFFLAASFLWIRAGHFSTRSNFGSLVDLVGLVPDQPYTNQTRNILLMMAKLRETAYCFFWGCSEIFSSTSRFRAIGALEREDVRIFAGSTSCRARHAFVALEGGKAGVEDISITGERSDGDSG